MAGSDTAQIGKWAFLIGVIIAVLAGVIPQLNQGTIGNVVVWLFLILGAAVGVLNITSKKTTDFLIAIIALVSVSGLGYGIGALTGVQVIGQWIADILKNIVAFVAPATLVVSLQAIWLLASKK